MTPRSKILQTFLQDALRLVGQALSDLSQLEEQAQVKRVSPGLVRSFYNVIHTLRGTAMMLEEAKRVAELLDGVERHLAERPVVSSARETDWISESRRVLTEAQLILQDLQRKGRIPGNVEPLVRGFMVRTTLPAEQKFLWFPISCVSRIVPPAEMKGKSVHSIEGVAYPVMGTLLTAEGRDVFGLAIKAQSGAAVLAIEEVVAVIAWSEAEERGAAAGLGLFEAQPGATAVAG